MGTRIEVVYSNGVLRPTAPVNGLLEGTTLTVEIAKSLIYRTSDARFLPHRRKDRMFELAPLDLGKARNRAEHQQLVGTEEEVVRLLRSGKYALRMSVGGTTAPRNLIEPDDITILS